MHQIVANKKLYIVATPIGNLGDITYRAVEILKSSDVVLAENTRMTLKIFSHYDIRSPLKPFNAYQEHQDNADKKLMNIFKQFNCVSLVSNAGTPCIFDPGIIAVKFCLKNSIPVIPIPGPNAAISCFSVSGLSSKNILFYGFLPNKKLKSKNLIINLLQNEKKVIIFYESSHRIQKTIQALQEYDDSLYVIIGKEITKKFENFLRGTPSKILEMFEIQGMMKGEFVLLVDNS